MPAQGIAAGANGQMWVTLPAAHALAVIEETPQDCGKDAAASSSGPAPLAACSPGIVVRAAMSSMSSSRQVCVLRTERGVVRAPKNGGPSGLSSDIPATSSV